MTWTQNLGRVKGDRGSALVPTIVQTATDIAISWMKTHKLAMLF